MEIFNNQERSGYEEIVSYGPKWWTEYREMDAVYRFAGWTLDLMARWLEQIVNDQFPAHASEKAIQVYEQVLGIEPDPDETLEERRRTVAAYYSGTGKLSGTVIKSLIKSYTGCESELWWDGLVLQIRIYLSDEEQFSARKIYSILGRRMPAHIDFEMRNVLCVFELSEYLILSRISLRMAFSWWSGRIDGSHNLDGSLGLSVVSPTEFVPKYPFAAQINEDVHFYYPWWKFLLESSENFSPAVRIRMPTAWWDVPLDGSANLDGSLTLDQIRPPFFAERYRAEAVIPEEFPIATQYHLTPAQHSEAAEIIPGQRIIANWWEGRRTMDGSFYLDGDAGNINQDVPPVWPKGTYSTDITIEETFAVSLYIPSNAVNLNGAAVLDGNINLNSGREEL